MGLEKGHPYFEHSHDLDAINARIHKEHPPVDPNTYSGSGHSVVEVFGVPSDFDVTVDNVQQELWARLAGLDESIGYESSVPILDLPDANRQQIYIDQLADYLRWRSGKTGEFDDISGQLVVWEQKNGAAGKLIVLCVGNKAGNPISEIDLKAEINPSRLVEEKKYAFLRQLEQQHPGRVRNLIIEIEDPDFMKWSFLRESVINAWLDGEISEQQMYKAHDLLSKLEEICGKEKPYIAIAKGQERSIDVRDFITVDEISDKKYLNLVFVDRTEDDETEVKIA